MTDHAEPREPEAAPEDGRLLQRRGLLAGGAAAAAAAAVALATAERAEAGHDIAIPAYDTQTVVHVDVTNTTAGSTRVSSNVGSNAAFVGLNNYPVGISRPDGILGRT